MSEELIPLEQVPEVKAEAFNISKALQEAIDAAKNKIEDRPFSGRHPELGKMVNCPFCGYRHRQNERKCEQKFTNRIGDYELLKEDDNGNLVPDYRTAVQEGERPTIKQVMGRAAFNKKRHRPHHSKIKLQFIERVRIVYQKIDDRFEANLSRVENVELKEKIETAYAGMFKELLQRARVVATRELRKERRFGARKIRLMQRLSRKINRG